MENKESMLIFLAQKIHEDHVNQKTTKLKRSMMSFDPFHKH